MSELQLPWDSRHVTVTRFDADDDPNAMLTPDELAEAGAFRLEKRRREWTLARAVAKRLAVSCGVAADPLRVTVARPFLCVDAVATEWYVSLSHSGEYAGAILDRAPVGIDVQMVRPVRESAAHLFLSDRELGAMQECAIDDRLLHFWCAKEAAWKQRSSQFTTLKQVPLRVEEVRVRGLLFDAAETWRAGDVIVAVTR